MAHQDNELGNIVSAVGHISGDCFVKDYDANFSNWANVTNTANWEQNVADGTIDGYGFKNVGFITTEGAPEFETPDTEDNTTTTDLWDGIAYKTGRTTITGRHLKFTLAEAERDAAIQFVNGSDAIDSTSADHDVIIEKGSNSTPQSIVIPAYLSDGKLSLIVIEKGMVVIDDVIKYTPNDPIVYAVDVDPQTGSKLPSSIVRYRQKIQNPAPAPSKSEK